MLERSETPRVEWPEWAEHPSAIRGAGDTAAAWERFAAGQEVSEGVRPEILLSWYRCRDDFRVDPLQTRAPSAADDWPARSLEDDVVVAELGGVAKSIESDAEAIDGLVAVTDGRGRILAAWGDRQTLQLADESNLAARCTWSEDMAGTNGIGTAIASTGPVFVKGSEHWCAGFHEWSCAGTAIREPVTNHPLGVLDVSTRRKPLPDSVLAFLRSPVHKVEAGLRTVPFVHSATSSPSSGSRSGWLTDRSPRPTTAGVSSWPTRRLSVLPHRPALSAPRAGTRASPAERSVRKAVERARPDPQWVGWRSCTCPRWEPPHGFVPARRAQQRVVGVLLTAPASEEDGELLTTEQAASPARRVRAASSASSEVPPDDPPVERGDPLRRSGRERRVARYRPRRLRAPERGLVSSRKGSEPGLPAGAPPLPRESATREGDRPQLQGCFWLVLDGPGRQLIPVSRRRTAEVRRSLASRSGTGRWPVPLDRSGFRDRSSPIDVRSSPADG